MAKLALAVLALAACGTKAAPAADGPAAPTDGTTDATGGIGDAGAPDPCPQAAPACPTATATENTGLQPIDRCAFPLADTGTWTDRAALVDALPSAVARVGWSDVAADLNRAAVPIANTDAPGNPPGVKLAFHWAAGDESVTYWIPQGITGSFDGDPSGTVAGRKLALVSWYYVMANDTGSTVDKGVRVAIVDVTNPAAIAYRFALLVEPIAGAGGHTDFAAVKVHAGGLAWIGNYLYVPVTGSGFRVFDLSRILRIPGTADTLGYDAANDTYNAYGYRYAIPLVGEYKDAGACNAVFSFVALDRSTTPLSLVSGEYDAASVNGRLYRWPLDATGRLAMTDRARVVGDGAWLLAQSHVQGALAHADTYWLSSSAPAGGAGALYRTGVQTPSTTLGWLDAPEDLAYDPQADRIWGLSEASGARAVVAVARAAVSP